MHYSRPKDRELNHKATTDCWVGDPCYVVPEECWGELCDNWSVYDNKHELDPEHEHHYVAQAEDKLTGEKFHLWNTAHGDGSYPLMIDGVRVCDLSVDAGVLSVIPVTLIEHWNNTGQISNYQDMGHVVQAELLHGEMVCDTGDFSWGGLSIATGDVFEDEDDLDDEEQLV